MLRTGALFLAAALAACAAPPPPPEAGGIAREEGWLLPGSRWRLVTLGDAPFAADLTAELTLDGRVVGEGPCNRFSAPYAGRWPDLTFAPAVATRRACPALALEAEALDAVGRVTRAAMTEGQLVLTGPDGVYLAFDPA